MSPSAKEKLVGVWKIVSYEIRRADGQILYPAGKDPLGTLILTADGHMSAQIMPADRPAFVSGNMLRCTPEEAQSALQGCISYFGVYTFNEEESKFTTRVIGSLFPNWIGGDQDRFFELADDRLSLRTQPMVMGGTMGTAFLIWERAGEVA